MAKTLNAVSTKNLVRELKARSNRAVSLKNQRQQLAVKLAALDKEIAEINGFGVESIAAHRGPGRPRGSTSKAAAKVATHRGPGRPKAKRGPGRPNGSTKAALTVATQRGPGRPRGSKNKSKVEVATAQPQAQTAVQEQPQNQGQQEGQQNQQPQQMQAPANPTT